MLVLSSEIYLADFQAIYMFYVRRMYYYYYYYVVDKFRKMDGNDVILIFEESLSLFPKKSVVLIYIYHKKTITKTIMLYKR